MLALLSNFSIRIKILSLIGLGLLGMLIVAGMGLRGTQQMNALTVDMYENQLKPIN